uniref:Putative ovule protein n=1 Tax=Solanum chacoense TaxID=4108 RepID=A0A0V0HF34_SOLCH
MVMYPHVCSSFLQSKNYLQIGDQKSNSTTTNLVAICNYPYKAQQLNKMDISSHQTAWPYSSNSIRLNIRQSAMMNLLL